MRTISLHAVYTTQHAMESLSSPGANEEKIEALERSLAHAEDKLRSGVLDNARVSLFHAAQKKQRDARVQHRSGLCDTSDVERIVYEICNSEEEFYLLRKENQWSGTIWYEKDREKAKEALD